jgi:hypothetical protein
MDKSGRIFQGRLWLKKGSFASDDEIMHWKGKDKVVFIYP